MRSQRKHFSFNHQGSISHFVCVCDKTWWPIPTIEFIWAYNCRGLESMIVEQRKQAAGMVDRAAAESSLIF